MPRKPRTPRKKKDRPPKLKMPRRVKRSGEGEKAKWREWKAEQMQWWRDEMKELDRRERLKEEGF